MAYSIKDWSRRIAERSDLSSGLVHLTRENNEKDVFGVLYDILSSRKLIGSTTDSGFICGKYSAVCFQDTPLTSICQNVFFEQKKWENDKTQKIRYRAFGLYFNKKYLYEKGARPVIYDKIEDAKKYLSKDEWWRIVNMNLSDDKNIIDWSHEREWRLKGDLDFEFNELTLLTIGLRHLNDIFKKYKEQTNIDIRDEIKGIITLENLLF